MTKALLACVVCLTAFAAGVAGAWLATRSIERRLDQQLQFALTREPESRARLSLYTVQLIQAGKQDAALAANCQMLRSSLPLLRAADMDTPAQQQVMLDLVEKGQMTVAALEKAGSCGE